MTRSKLFITTLFSITLTSFIYANPYNIFKFNGLNEFTINDLVALITGKSRASADTSIHQELNKLLEPDYFCRDCGTTNIATPIQANNSRPNQQASGYLTLKLPQNSDNSMLISDRGFDAFTTPADKDTLLDSELIDDLFSQAGTGGYTLRAQRTSPASSPPTPNTKQSSPSAAISGTTSSPVWNSSGAPSNSKTGPAKQPSEPDDETTTSSIDGPTLDYADPELDPRFGDRTNR